MGCVIFREFFRDYYCHTCGPQPVATLWMSVNCEQYHSIAKTLMAQSLNTTL